MIHTIPLPFGRTVQVCDICGNAEGSTIERCRCAGAVDGPPVKIGDVVEMYHRVFKDGRVARSEKTWPVHITGFSYAAPLPSGFALAFALAGNSPESEERPIHELTVHFERHDEHGTVGIGSYPIAMFTLWREGNEAGLIAAGLIRPPRTNVRRRWPWTRFWE